MDEQGDIHEIWMVGLVDNIEQEIEQRIEDALKSNQTKNQAILDNAGRSDYHY